MIAGLDALELLRNVSNAYRAMATLEVEAVNINESGDEDASSRSEQRVRFSYSAPNRVRYEPCGKDGMVQVVDGAHLHTLFRHNRGLGGGPRVITIPISEMHFLPHVFRPDFPLTNDATFLFQGIEEGVADAHILRQEDGCYVVAVTYSQPSPHPGVVVRGDILFWVNPVTLMVMKQQGDLGYRFPVDDEMRWTRLTMSVRNIRLNEPLSDDTFRFTPPADANKEIRDQNFDRMRTAMRPGTAGGGGGGGSYRVGPTGRIEYGSHSQSHWDGDSVVITTHRFHAGYELVMHERLRLEPERGELTYTHEITGPDGNANQSEAVFKVKSQ